MKEQNVIDDLVNGADADEELTQEETREDMLDLLSGLSVNRGERGEINLDAAKGKAKARLTQAVVDLNAEYEKSWDGIAFVLGPETASRLRVRFEPWLKDGSETAPSIEDLYDEIVKPLPSYPHCSECGAVLALDAEKERGKCEACAPLADAAITPDGAAAPVNVPLPFPIPPPEPFDEHAAFLDICGKNATVKSLERVYLELKERTKSAKDQWEAAASTASQAIAEYDRKSREADEYAIRQEKLQAAYVEKLEADAATAAQPELSIEPVLVTAADRVPDLASATPLADALPTCACGNALALDTEKATGVCDWCSDTGQR